MPKPSLQINVSGLDELEQGLKDAPKEAFDMAAKQAASLLAGEIAKLAIQWTPVLTGRLRNSTKVEGPISRGAVGTKFKVRQSKEYAFIVHSDPQWTVQSGKKKWMQKALRTKSKDGTVQNLIGKVLNGVAQNIKPSTRVDAANLALMSAKKDADLSKLPKFQ